MDWYSRYVLSWEVSVTMDDGLCVSSLERAIRHNVSPEIFNTDFLILYKTTSFNNLMKILMQYPAQEYCLFLVVEISVS
jgi:putative transposase